MAKFDIRCTFTIGADDNADIQEVADNMFEGNRSQSLRALLAERRLLLAKQAALGRRPTEEERAKWDGAGGG